MTNILTYTALDTLYPVDPAWLSILEQARQQMHCQNLPRPVGLPEKGHYGLAWMPRNDGAVRCSLRYQTLLGTTTIGVWLQASAPSGKERRTRGQITTEGKIIAINAGTELERRIRVMIDGTGQPYPVPVYP